MSAVLDWRAQGALDFSADPTRPLAQATRARNLGLATNGELDQYVAGWHEAQDNYLSGRPEHEIDAYFQAWGQRLVRAPD